MAGKKIGYIKGNRVDFKDGFIVLPPLPGLVNLAEPDIYAESATALYPIGTLLWFPGMGKKYRYAKAGVALTGTKFLVANGNYAPTDTNHLNYHGFFGHSDNNYAAGANEITFSDTRNKAKDFYEGAHMIHFQDSCYEESYIISGPPAAITTPWSCTIKLLEKKKYAYTTPQGIEIWCNPYSNIKLGCESADAYDGYETYMGVPPIPVTGGHYFWLQTAGPVFITPNGWATDCPGYAANSRVCTAGLSSGNINAIGGTGTGYQIIGHLLAVTSAGFADAFVNMDLDLGH